MTKSICKKTESCDESQDVKRNKGADPHRIISRRDCPRALCLARHTLL